MKQELPEINCNNQDQPKSYFEVVKIEDLLKRKLEIAKKKLDCFGVSV